MSLEDRTRLVDLKAYRLRRSNRLKEGALQPYWDQYRSIEKELHEKISNYYEPQIELHEAICAGNISLSKADQNLLKKAIGFLIPWRLGPFGLGSEYIDGEWNSSRKWKLIKPLVGDIRDKLVADVGCNNGYFMFRLSALAPKEVIGFDPSARCFFQFRLLQLFLQRDNLSFEPLGLEDLVVFENLFDLTLCMGVIYHRRDPVTCLQYLKKSLRKEGRLILESLVIPQEGPYALSPPERYAKMRNVWFIPSSDCLIAWLKKAGFSRIEKVCEEVILTDEQRRTQFAPDESLADFLNPFNPDLTVEGYPRPRRAIITATK
jgi:tRNA (mo5U34)-methyltransferase